MWVELAAIGAASLVAIVLAVVGLRLLIGEARKGASSGERADRLAESARRQAKAEEVGARPISGNPDTVADNWARRAARRVSKSAKSRRSA